MRIPFRSGRKCWAYFSLIILFNAVCLYCGWLSLKTTTVGVKRKKLSSKPLDVAVYLVPRSDTLPNRIPDVPATASWWSGDDVLTSSRANGTPTARPAYRVTRGKTDDPAVLRTRQYFHTRMSAREFRICTDILRRFVELVEPQNLTYFMYGGTLLGSYRHHGIIPWDDDLDIIMKISEKELVRNILSPLSPHYFLNGKQGKRWKFYSSLSRPIPGITWAWPYLDISFFKENKTHIWDSDPLFSRSYVYKKTEIFPLVRRPFMDFMLPAPRDTGAALSKHYSFSICKSNTYDHKREIFVSQFRRRTLPCVLLKDMFPIVSHHSAAKGTNETLEYNGKVVKWFLRKN